MLQHPVSQILHSRRRAHRYRRCHQARHPEPGLDETERGFPPNTRTKSCPYRESCTGRRRGRPNGPRSAQKAPPTANRPMTTGQADSRRAKLAGPAECEASSNTRKRTGGGEHLGTDRMRVPLTDDPSRGTIFQLGVHTLKPGLDHTGGVTSLGNHSGSLKSQADPLHCIRRGMSNSLSPLPYCAGFPHPSEVCHKLCPKALSQLGDQVSFTEPDRVQVVRHARRCGGRHAPRIRHHTLNHKRTSL